MKTLLLVVLVIILFMPAAFGDPAEGKKPQQTDLGRFIQREVPNYGSAGFVESKWPSQLYYLTPYDGGLLGTPTIPIGFSKVTFDTATSSFNLEPNFSVGLGYTFFFGDFYFTEENKIHVNPYFMFGPAIDVAAAIDSTTNVTKFVFDLGVFCGFQSVSLYLGYDFLRSKLLLGLGTRLDFFTLDTTALQVYGQKVRPVFGYKSDAKLILDAWHEQPPEASE